MQDDQASHGPSGTSWPMDKITETFYGKFPYPWPPVRFDYYLDPDFETAMLHQNIGDWNRSHVPTPSRIWVAGCGTNQAIFTALKFPNASVLGSDLSVKSLEICATIAHQMGLSNLRLRKESITRVSYQEEFDYVICTGVIMHNTDPGAALQKLSQALKRDGIMELMVYNKYHRIINIAFQQAIRTLAGDIEDYNFERELALARKIIKKPPIQNLVADFLSRFTDAPEAMVTDELIQPVESSYTVETLADLADQCNLEMLYPYTNTFDKARDLFSWHIAFFDPDLQHVYDALPDLHRWRVTNHLLLEKSPMLWFYLQRKDSGRERQPERQICESFLNTHFTKVDVQQASYVLGEDRKYRLSPQSTRFPMVLPDAAVKNIYNAVDPATPIRDVFQKLGLDTSFQNVNQVRMRLATSAFPYLRAVQASEEM